MKTLLRIIYTIYLLISGLILICLFPILLPLQALNKEPLFLYSANDKVKIWFNKKIYGQNIDK
jgi:hypothetical protein